MNDVTGVRAKPGGRVTLRFTGNGFRAVPRPRSTAGRMADALLCDAGCAVSLLVAVLAGAFAAHRWETGETEAALVLAAVAAPFAVVVVTRVVIEAVGHAVLLLVVAGAVLFSPLLLFPGVRRRARAWWKRDTPSGKGLLDRHIFVDEIEPVSVTRDGSTVTVVLMVGEHRARYRSSDGDALEGEFRALLSAPRPATGVGP
jgi:uncharacterized membrane protein YgdD (TMEM256/DUF423 family)